MRDAIRLKHYSIRTEEAYVNWVKRYIYFHDVRHPAEMGAAEVVDALRAKRPKRLPTVLTKDETLHLTACLSSTHQLMAKLIYGSGIRLMECLRLRVNDLKFERRAIIVRDGKGAQDRVTVLPDSSARRGKGSRSP